MKNAVILHGGPTEEEYYDKNLPSQSNSHWIPWLQQQLQANGIPSSTPEVPNSYDRIWKVWLKEVSRFEIGPKTILVGHSTGAGFFIKYLSIHKDLRVGKVVLVAPWLDPDHKLDTHFFDDFEIDSNLISRTAGLTVFSSDNDMEDVQRTAETIRQKLPLIKYKQFHNYGHFCYGDMHTIEFPELVEEILEN